MISDEIKEKLPENFSIDDIGRIDLKEAEAIANENFLFLTEEDLIEGLEDFELIPLEENNSQDDEKKILSYPEMVGSSVEKEIPAESIAPLKETEPVKISDSTDHDKKMSAETDSPDESEKKVEICEEKRALTPETLDDETRKFIDESVIKTEFITNENLMDSFNPEIPGGIETVRQSPRKRELSEVIDKEEENDFEDFICLLEEVDSKTTFIPVSENDQTIHLDREDLSELKTDEDDKTEPESEGINRVEKKLSPEENNKVQTPDLDFTADDEFSDINNEILLQEHGEYIIPQNITREVIPEKILNSDAATGFEVIFVDDEIVDKPLADEIENRSYAELERLSLEIIEGEEGKAKLLYESDSLEEAENIGHFAGDSSTVFEDLLIDFDDDAYKYQDEEIDFIYTAIVEEDYARYIREIDEYHYIDGQKKLTPAVELFGATPDELEFIEEKMFAEEYKDVNLDEMFDFLNLNFLRIEYSSIDRENCSYLLPKDDSFEDWEKDSIEEDISSARALVFEEDVEQIRSKIASDFKKNKPEEHVSEQIKEGPKIKTASDLVDITDRVIIIEDEIDVDRFIQDFPEEKQANLRKLLAYLDGLFEKLPEKTIKNFADSEYFDLYLKVLNDMGI